MSINIKIIDNFFQKDDFFYLCNLKLANTDSNKINVFHNSINHNGIIKNSCIEKDFLKKLHNKYHDKAIELLKELCPDKVRLYNYSEFHLVETGKNFSFPIHDDTPNKLLSGVIYLYPENNVGTLFYDNSEGYNKREIKWLQNRAVFFSRIEKKTWHSYEGDKVSNRVALVYNLMTKDIKKVAEIEKKNYFLMSLRNNLNPYLNRFLKFTI